MSNNPHPLLHHFKEHPTHHHAPLIPYKEAPYHAHTLHTLSLWIPTAKFSPKELVKADPGDLWVIYIHGGAWRDPKVSAASFNATASALLSPPSNEANDLVSSQKGHIAALASLNYSLSPHADDPHNRDPSRQASHPQHIIDVLSALQFLHAHFPSVRERRYVLLGHSCGTTLALQTLMHPARLGRSNAAQASLPLLRREQKPAAVVPIAGLYDLPGLIADPGADHEELVPVYRTFTQAAFGSDESLWAAVSPTQAARAGAEEPGIEWGGEEMLVVLTQSHGDSLVPWRQMEGFRAALEERGWKEAHLEKVGEEPRGTRFWKVQEIKGDHNGAWEDGQELAKVVLRTIAWVRGRREKMGKGDGL